MVFQGHTLAAHLENFYKHSVYKERKLEGKIKASHYFWEVRDRPSIQNKVYLIFPVLRFFYFHTRDQETLLDQPAAAVRTAVSGAEHKLPKKMILIRCW